VDLGGLISYQMQRHIEKFQYERLRVYTFGAVTNAIGNIMEIYKMLIDITNSESLPDFGRISVEVENGCISKQLYIECVHALDKGHEIYYASIAKNIKFKHIQNVIDEEYVEDRFEETLCSFPFMTSMKMRYVFKNKFHILISNDKFIISNDISIYNKCRVWISHKTNIIDLIYRLFRGRGVFCGHEYYGDRGFDVVHNVNEVKCIKYFSFYTNVIKTKGESIACIARSLLLHRIQFLYHARDVINNLDVEKTYFERYSSNEPFHSGLLIAYHLNMFYLILWGVIDQALVMYSKIKCIDINEKQCSINNSKFRKMLTKRDTALSNFLNKDKVYNWIDLMGKIRHHAAHKIINLPSLILMETSESKKDVEEIKKIVKEEISMQNYPNEFEDIILRQKVDEWRTKHMYRISSNFIVMQDDNGQVLYDPIVSMDLNMEYMHAVLDAILFATFNTQPSRED